MMFSRACAYAAAMPDTTATARSSSDGCRRASISGVSRLSGLSSASTDATSRASTTPTAIVRTAPRNSVSSRLRIAIANETIGDINGASTIAPITTAGLLSIRPRPASSADASIRNT